MKRTGKNYASRAKLAVKRSLLCDAAGIRLAAIIDAANLHNVKLLERTLEALAPRRPGVGETRSQGTCLDKGYDAKWVREHLLAEHWTPHVRCCGTLIPSCKRPEHHLGSLHLTCGLITQQRAGLLGWVLRLANR